MLCKAVFNIHTYFPMSTLREVYVSAILSRRGHSGQQKLEGKCYLYRRVANRGSFVGEQSWVVVKMWVDVFRGPPGINVGQLDADDACLPANLPRKYLIQHIFAPLFYDPKSQDPRQSHIDYVSEWDNTLTRPDTAKLTLLSMLLEATPHCSAVGKGRYYYSVH